VKGLSKKAALGLTTLALASLPFANWMASAHAHSFQSNLSIHFDKHHDTIWGHVGTASFCQEGRTITVSQNGSVVDTTASGHAGMWSVPASGSGSYTAAVAQSPATGYGSDRICLGDTTGPIQVP